MIPAYPAQPGLGSIRGVRKNDFRIFGASPELPLGDLDSEGVMWWWNDIEGWFDSSAFTATVASLGNSDYGTWKERFPRAPKNYTIKGTCYAADKTKAWAARERLMRYWGDPNVVFDLVVDEPTGAKKAEVRLNDQIKAPWPDSIGRARGFTFEIPLVARDSLKYSLAPVTDSTATQSPSVYGLTLPITFPMTFTSSGDADSYYAVLVNEGNEASPPVSVISGAIETGWRIQNLNDGGKTIWVDKALGAGDVLEMNHKNGLAKINGSSVDISVSGEWFSLVPGENRIRLISPTATTALLTVSGFSAWR